MQHSNLQFAQQRRSYGAKYHLYDLPAELRDLEDENAANRVLDVEYQQVERQQLKRTHAEATTWAVNQMQRTRGRELPGNFNPMLIGQLFREQSEPWAGLAKDHVSRVAEYCTLFTKDLLRSITNQDVYDKLLVHLVKPALERRETTAYAELAKALDDKDNHPITYNHYYTTTVQRIRAKNHTKKLKMLVTKHRSERTTKDQPSLTCDDFIQDMEDAVVEEDMDRFSADDALTSQMAYYKV